MALPPYATLGQKMWYVAFRIICALGFLFLLGPILAVLPISFSSSSFLSYPIPSLSMKSYKALFVPYPWIMCFKNSLIVASSTTVLSMILGTLAAYGLTMADFRFKSILIGLMISPLVVPVVITALATYLFLGSIGMVGTYLGLIVVHTALAVPFVLVTVMATLQGFDINLIRAGASLGARPHNVFLQITLPLILPGVLSGAAFAFITSFDEIVVAMFIAGPSQITLPRQLFAGLRDHLDPSIVAVAALLIAISITFMGVIELLHWRNERLQGP